MKEELVILLEKDIVVDIIFTPMKKTDWNDVDLPPLFLSQVIHHPSIIRSGRRHGRLWG